MAVLFTAVLSGLFAVGCGGPKANPNKPEAPNGSADVNVDVGTPLYKAKALGRSRDGQSAAGHDVLLYGPTPKRRR